MRIIILLLSATLLLANTDNRIKNNEDRLKNISTKQDTINKKLKILGNEINSKDSKMKELDQQITDIQANINTNKKLYTKQEQIYKDYEDKQKSLRKEQEKLQKSLIDVVLKDMAIVMILNSKEPLSEDSIISEEILKQASQSAKVHIKAIQEKQEKLAQEMREAESKISSTRQFITTQQEKKLALQNAKEKQKRLKKRLRVELNAYNAELKKLDEERSGIQKILVNLNIIKERETQDSIIDTPKNIKDIPIEVRRIGKSYQQVVTAKYNGAKTIAPLKNYSIEAKYGTYFDPVYKIKAFNEFITLGVKRKSAVMSVLDGKIVFAKNTGLLKKVIVIEHKNKIHTIYSHLDEFPNTLKVGKQVKKGDTIAFVKEKLNFEVTQADKHINPLDMIRTR